MRRNTTFAKDHIGAFVGHYPTSLAHPTEDRYINYRESMSIMGMPEDFELLDPAKNSNHVCQSVPVQTAHDMAFEVLQYLNGNRPTIKADYVLQRNHDKSHQVFNDGSSTPSLLDL